MRRRLSILLAALVALGSGIGLLGYVRGADARATEGVDLVPVLVAKGDIALGTLFSTAWDAGAITAGATLQRLRPPTAAVYSSETAGLVTGEAIADGQIIVSSMFAAAGTAPTGPATFAAHVPDGDVAVSFSASAEQAVGNLIQPGDHVNLLVEVPEAADIGLPPTNGPAIVHVFQHLEVIAIGAAVADPTAATAPENPGTGIYTVGVSPTDSARLLFLTQHYPVFLTLVGDDTNPTAVPPVAAANAYPGADR